MGYHSIILAFQKIIENAPFSQAKNFSFLFIAQNLYLTI